MAAEGSTGEGLPAVNLFGARDLGSGFACPRFGIGLRSSIETAPETKTKLRSSSKRARLSPTMRLSVSKRQPTAQLRGSFERRLAIERHQRGGSAGDSRDLRAPFVSADTGH